ncbi:MAG: diadenosine tetraphosphate hydrolase [Candidatus Parabeggiatoa sp. nov. 3]|nr:MAG: diadenosine tetraphosphate hydrolase [Gammaproteobacteria bacterium]RKZ67596.1 MAG: diadenosine tetraphosphate hydrolase [Gammaproteobacteria bacterium]RKZ87627.1 MAG: diadenosine tetraphosphate hydrolase [Gammaproteobacteria bacterium]
MYNHAPDDYVCPFCRIVQKLDEDRIPDIVYQNEDISVFIGLDHAPNNLGHAIIIPNQHFENIYDLPLHLATKIHDCARKLAWTLKESYSCEGTSLHQHNEPAGDQRVWHYHLHVLPRYKNDGVYTGLPVRRLTSSERAKYARKLRTLLKEKLTIPSS